MGKRGVTLILVGSLLGGEAAGEICKHGGPYWLPDHAHTEVPETDAGGYRRTISVDSGVTSTATGTMNFLKSLGVPFLTVGPNV